MKPDSLTFLATAGKRTIEALSLTASGQVLYRDNAGSPGLAAPAMLAWISATSCAGARASATS